MSRPHLSALRALVCGVPESDGAVLTGLGIPAGPDGEPHDPPLERAGALVIAGGGLLPGAVRERFVELAGGARARLVVIPTAAPSMNGQPPEEHEACAAWQDLDGRVESLVFLHTRRRQQADEESFVQPLSTATGVWLAGGDQTLLIEAYQGTAVERELHDLLACGGVIGGTSAGAAVMSKVMIRGGNPVAELGRGFGFLRGVIVDQHLSERDRLPRLQGAVARHPGYLGLGIDEQTAVVVQGRVASVLGERQVHVCFPGQSMVKVFLSGERIDLDALPDGTNLSMPPPADITAGGCVPCSGRTSCLVSDHPTKGLQ
jgi:cyanophycinase